ncbi:copper resistance protein [Listeria weihenstephanensis FSL R9-0317]|uniref:copper resistance CopC/CopD family protein n=1 Tax=Listeria weihenstephanensis TaxID=1006155 RepID=UPI0003E86A9C|nr:copper resistance CopC/CopD family protein [Listeria weihenstephanensis]EUJ36227.1 copper resistance protein [Listeria weihenstephanensis FSL R9-0317]
MKKWSLWGISLFAVVLFLFTSPTAVEAHAYLQSSNPADQSELAKSPDKVVLTFTEMIQNEYPSIIVRDSEGKRVEDGKAYINKENDHVVEVGLASSLPADIYSAEWRVVSADGHPVSGVISFKIGNVDKNFTASAVGKSDSSSWPSTLVKVILYIGFSVVAGVLLFYIALYRGKVDEKLRRRTVQALTVGIGLLLIGFLLFLPVQVQIYTGGNGLDFDAMKQLIQTSTIGHLWLIQLGSLLLLIVSFVVIIRKQWMERVWIWLVSLCFFLVILFAKAMQGHAAGSPDKTIAIPMDFLHLLSASAWVGGILVLFFLLAKQKLAKETWNRFSPYAAGFVAVIIVSGLLMSVMNIGSMTKLFTTEYGKVILLKVALFLVMGALGLVHYLYMRQTGRQLSAKTIIAEFGIGIAILGVAAFLTNVQTPPPAPPEAFSEKVAVKSGYVTLKIAPAIVGENTFMVVFTDEDGQVRSDFQQVRLTAVPNGGKKESEFQAVKDKQDVYVATGLYLNATGRWEIKIHALGNDFSEIDTSFTIKIKQ